MGKKEREEILKYASMRYGTEAEYLWKTSPSYAVLRHAENRKWYGILMNVPRERLGLSGKGEVDILNVKCDPVLGGALRLQAGFLPGYHMKKDSWISILLDGTVDPNTIFSLFWI